MKTLKYWLLSLAILLAACTPAGTDTTPAVSETAPTPDQGSVPDGTTAPGLTEAALKNAEYIIIQDEQPYSIQLTDGSYQYGTDPTADDYVSISLADLFAFGDLNGDGATDAIALLVESYGGGSIYISMVAVIDQDGMLKHVSSAYIDVAPVIYKLEIEDGEIFMDVVVHGPNDELSSPSQAENRAYRLGARGLVLTHLASKTADGQDRAITIASPSEGSEVGRIFPLKGSVTIAPFENNLVVKVFDASGNQVYIGPLAVTAADLGAPGTFDASVNLEGIEVASGPIRIEVSDVSMADGSTLALDSVVVVLK